mgnify:CR=1 FL=1
MTRLSLLFNMIRMDPIILVPFLGYQFVVQVIQAMFSEPKGVALGLIMGLTWVMGVFAKAFTLYLGLDLVKDNALFIDASFKKTKARLTALLLATGIFVFPFFILFYMGLQPGEEVQASGLLVLLMLLSVPLSFILHLLPVHMVLIELPWKQSVRKTLQFITTHFKETFRMIVTVFFFWMSSLLLALFVYQVPVIGESVLFAVVQALGSCIVYLFVLLFLLERKKPSLFREFESYMDEHRLNLEAPSLDED